jgi:hypothetical protein
MYGEDSRNKIASITSATCRSGGVVVLAAERILERRGHTGIRAGRRQLLVGEQFGLHRDPRLAVHRLHLIADRRDRPLGK